MIGTAKFTILFVALLYISIMYIFVSKVRAIEVVGNEPADIWMKNFGTGNYGDVISDVSFNSIDDVVLIGGVVNYDGNPYVPAYLNADLNDDGDVLDFAETGMANQLYNNNLIIDVFGNKGVHKWSKRFLNNSKPSLSIDSNDKLVLFGVESGNFDLNADGDVVDNIGESSTGYGGNDLYITSFSKTGSYLWSKRLGSTLHDSGSIYLDSDNNIIIGGTVSGASDLNGDGDSIDAEGESASGYGGQDIILTSFTSDGTFRWSKRLGGSGDDTVNSVVTDSSRNVYITGSVTGAADLNGDGDTLDTGETSGTGYFLSSFDSSGTFRWSMRVGGSIVKIDSDNNIIVAGRTVGDIDLNGDTDVLDDGESATGYGLDDIFITSFASNQTHIWSKRFGGTANDMLSLIKTNDNQDIIIAGMVSSVGVDLNGDGDFLDGVGEIGTSYGGRDVVLISFDKTGSYIWSTRLGGDGDDQLVDLALDKQGQVFVSGWINQNDNADLNGDGDDTDASGGELVKGHIDPFLSSFDSTGTFKFSKRFGGVNQDGGLYLAISNTNDFMVWGDVNPNGLNDINGDGDTTDSENENNPGSYAGLFATYFRTANFYAEGIDTTDPTGTISINGGSEYSSSVNVTLTLSATDSESGMSEMMISNDSSFTGASWETYATNKAWVLATGNGSKVVYIKYRDVLENTSVVYSDSIMLDTTLPSLTELSVNGNLVTSGSTLNLLSGSVVAITGTTDPSIAVRITIQQTGGVCNTTSNQSGDFSCEFSNLSDGSYTVIIRTTNIAGGYSENSLVLGIGTSNGTGSSTGTSLPNTSNDSKFILLVAFLFLILTAVEVVYIRKKQFV